MIAGPQFKRAFADFWLLVADDDFLVEIARFNDEQRGQNFRRARGKKWLIQIFRENDFACELVEHDRALRDDWQLAGKLRDIHRSRRGSRDWRCLGFWLRRFSNGSCVFGGS